jgi:hypothetical protein
MAPATKEKLLDMLSHRQKRVLLKMEVAAVVDAGRPLVQATYVLEGDGPLLVQCYEELSKVSASFSTAYYPNTKAVALLQNPVILLLNRLLSIMQLNVSSQPEIILRRNLMP